MCHFSGTIVNTQWTLWSWNCFRSGIFAWLFFTDDFSSAFYLFVFLDLLSFGCWTSRLIGYISYLCSFYFYFLCIFALWSGRVSQLGLPTFLLFPPHCSHIFNGQELVGAVYSSLNVLSYNIPQFHKKLLHFLQKIIPRYFTFFLVVILNEIFFHCILH